MMHLAVCPVTLPICEGHLPWIGVLPLLATMEEVHHRGVVVVVRLLEEEDLVVVVIEDTTTIEGEEEADMTIEIDTMNIRVIIEEEV
jgi:hypothetical protein